MRLLLRADGAERRNWLDLFSAPFDPSVEVLSQDGQEHLVLNVARLGASSTPREAYDAGKLAVREMNAIVARIVGKSNVTLTGTVRLFGDRLLVDFIMETETAHFRFGAGAARFQILDQHGEPIVEEAAPSIAQERYKAAAAQPILAEALAYSAGAPDWFDLYKACECLLAAGVKLDSGMKEVKQTANAFRHRVNGSSRLPPNPPSLLDAVRRTRPCINRELDR
ncbi:MULTISPECIES: hypothetical protein [unclassified Mesorhizobium]|uniref:hypothetical protein n=1 Tax=unclassified Mesorhizobium TaxID=325217 RepID=UPI000FCA6BAD|nr:MULTISPECIES: hypothetical protein [unclassified Mesorhizobium]RUX00549.1 hypothetical protein EOA35_18780 [Mesorhizobium sp. M8A.F.Ca.ET.023.01.1.1]RVD52848.1 hypothetical protein EN746_11125 [Mesorhizobium sp. M8A.F.Ca.ET.023.02.2.1]TGR36898.1 hypothetical protein EN842_52425 [bacterium M00.F.Ca.ET.199.01.1.1]TGU17775.1 hypothetical protein EN799_62395 [bacterium M00.F.Ca.ET.156.01.1.1]TGV82074.1 hypothetical protein EN792_031770 [Mesorhizobium sp. M00.F.Ca.ET.149.01.1.1]TGW07952.1 hypot